MQNYFYLPRLIQAKLILWLFSVAKYGGNHVRSRCLLSSSKQSFSGAFFVVHGLVYGVVFRGAWYACSCTTTRSQARCLPVDPTTPCHPTNTYHIHKKQPTPLRITYLFDGKCGAHRRSLVAYGV